MDWLSVNQILAFYPYFVWKIINVHICFDCIFIPILNITVIISEDIALA